MSDIIKTAPPEYQGGRIYTPDPAAVARLKRLMEEQRNAKQIAQETPKRVPPPSPTEPMPRPPRIKAAKPPRPPRIKAAKPPRPPRRILSDEQARDLYSQYMAGQAIMALSAQSGFCVVTIRRHFKLLGFPLVRRAAPLPITAEQLAAAYARHGQGQKWDDVAKEMRIDRKRLTAALRAAGYETRRPAAASPKRRVNNSPRKPITAEQLAAAITRHEMGHSWSAIASDLSISRKTLTDAVKRAGHNTGNRRHTGGQYRLGDKDTRQLHARYTNGEKVKTLAAEIRCKPSTIWKSFKRLGLPLTTARKLPPGTILMAVERHAAGDTWNDIAAGIGISGPTLCKAVRMAGYETKRL